MPHICESVAWTVAFTCSPQPSLGGTRKIKKQDGHFSPSGGSGSDGMISPEGSPC